MATHVIRSAGPARASPDTCLLLTGRGHSWLTWTGLVTTSCVVAVQGRKVERNMASAHLAHQVSKSAFEVVIVSRRE